jgi:hypothetical protein
MESVLKILPVLKRERRYKPSQLPLYNDWKKVTKFNPEEYSPTWISGKNNAGAGCP